MNPTVQYYPRHDEWIFGGQRRSYDGAGSLVIKRNDLALATATDLARALRRARKYDAEPKYVLIDLAPDEEYAPKECIVDPICFTLLEDGQLGIRCDLSTDSHIESDNELLKIAAPLLKPLLQRLTARLISVQTDVYRSTAPFFHEALITTPTRSKKLSHLYELGESVSRLFDSANTGEVTRETAEDLILGGRPELLIGLPEGEWLDVKSHHYDLKTDKGKISLAEAVSRFANAEDGGIVVVGMEN